MMMIAAVQSAKGGSDPAGLLRLWLCSCLQLAFFLLGLCYGCVTFKLAGQVHLEAYYAMPKGRCKNYVACMAVVSRSLGKLL
jgi:hypothetical protein